MSLQYYFLLSFWEKITIYYWKKCFQPFASLCKKLYDAIKRWFVLLKFFDLINQIPVPVIVYLEQYFAIKKCSLILENLTNDVTVTWVYHRIYRNMHSYAQLLANDQYFLRHKNQKTSWNELTNKFNSILSGNIETCWKCE